eukprot:CAMPEP_0113558768 /NCGR_PEP_ID=MMETSP0015_2-20120614/18530_1 /TAXON_ID=2838 /ORGANISM="Odontella" /LENGTH=42 /DNA_ID=CAMNT_0000460341 /DNA_START=251 /DNA_END=379 /DNA_ORIENTATION=- /assembly_acc=CAM_ASM_000160
MPARVRGVKNASGMGLPGRLAHAIACVGACRPAEVGAGVLMK